MQLMRSQRGVSLIELVIAIFLVSSVVVSLSMAFPKASANVAQTQQRSIATNLAQAQLQVIKSRPYAFTDTTDADASVGQFNILCNCASVGDLSVLPSTTTAMAGTVFHTAPCVHFVNPPPSPGPSWTSQCLDPTDPSSDTGYKHIVVYVYWTNGQQSYVTSQESMISRI